MHTSKQHTFSYDTATLYKRPFRSERGIRKGEIVREATLNQVSHRRRKKPGDKSRRQTRREDSRSPVRMERILGSHRVGAVVTDCD
jgi:hypothetical protein